MPVAFDELVFCRRKDVISAREKSDGSLWYAVPYEGFEALDHVIYVYSYPNPHLLPLLGGPLPPLVRAATWRSATLRCATACAGP